MTLLINKTVGILIDWTGQLFDSHLSQFCIRHHYLLQVHSSIECLVEIGSVCIHFPSLDTIGQPGTAARTCRGLHWDFLWGKGHSGPPPLFSHPHTSTLHPPFLLFPGVWPNNILRSGLIIALSAGMYVVLHTSRSASWSVHWEGWRPC